ncbi:asparagine synthase-related protein [Amycolatopsis nigrescens]|uniref:asparagine synthase-related protein n=1 Tax=Amycolatopsis nigrescens TaxID=381445 RepID=UPI0003A70E23|nr:asparagine synthase-related protein [Amycolatopsis nigrescens]
MAESWFVVLPDRAAAGAVADALDVTRMVPHASGRPWLLGRWAADEIRLVERGPDRLALLGPCAAQVPEPDRPGELDRVAAALPGSLHLAASTAGTVRVQGTVSGLRRVFRARVGGVPVAADRADVLAALTRSTVDEEVLALYLLGMVPHPLLGTPPWRRVHAVPPDCWYRLDADGGDRVLRWWHPPEPVLSLAEGAGRLRAALSTAVGLRTAAGGTVTADLSGGLDSTPLCFLAARGPARVVYFTTGGRNPGDDDLYWAERAVRELGDAEHDVLPPELLSPPYQDILRADVPMDEPLAAAAELARAVQLGTRLASHRPRLHLTGRGGDEVLVVWEQYLNDLVRRRPLRALGHARGYRSVFGWPVGATLRALADRRGYRDWIATEATRLTAAQPPRNRPSDGWAPPLRLPAWTTGETVEAVRNLLLDNANEPLDGRRGRHVTLQALRHAAYEFRLGEQVLARSGVRVASPYLDDRVVEACLAVRSDELSTPWRHKPLIAEAMRGIVPDAVFGRTTKAETSADLYVGLRRHRGELLELFSDSWLAGAGLVDPAALRAFFQLPLGSVHDMAGAWQTIAAELWLRRVAGGTEGKGILVPKARILSGPSG